MNGRGNDWRIKRVIMVGDIHFFNGRKIKLPFFSKSKLPRKRKKKFISFFGRDLYHSYKKNRVFDEKRQAWFDEWKGVCEKYDSKEWPKYILTEHEFYGNIHFGLWDGMIV